MPPPNAIGPYRLIRVIGEGGMGSVFLAEQDAPVRRSVAIKIIRTPFARAEDRVRFQAEQQAMARLQHPNVAQIYESGTTPEGYPYFVMELLDGEEMSEYCDRRALTLERRLELFIGVCDGVQHAHQKSIVHRDLKPSNILVVEIDGRPVPKIIDFGIAKSLDQPLVDSAGPTKDGVMGTLAYVSPEAVSNATRGDLDTRADVYSLGLVLYKLLAGDQPYEANGVLLDHILRIVQLDTPAPATFFASQPPMVRALVAQQRGVTPAALERRLRGDVAAIVLKTVAKDREERYPSVSELQSDIRRFLAHEPVEASAPGTLDRLLKFAVRHRGAVAATLVIALTLVAGIVARTIEARRAREARKEAELVTTFLVDLFDEGIPHNTKGTEVTMHDLLVEGAKRIDVQLVDTPLARAKVLRSIGRALMHQGDDERAQKLLSEALALQRQALGADHPNVAETLVELGVLRQRYNLEEGEKYLRDAVRIRELRLGPDDLWLANSLADLADVRRQQRQYGDAEQLLLRSIAIRKKSLPADDPLLAASYSGLGRVYRDARRFDEAERYLFQALTLRTKAYGPDHYVTSRSYDSIAELRAAQQRWPEAEEFLRKDLAIVERIRGANHKYTAWVRVDLAETLVHQGRAAEAREQLIRALPNLEHAADLQHVAEKGLRLLREVESRPQGKGESP